MNIQNIVMMSLALLLLTTAKSWASDLTIPNTFRSDTKAVAAEVNANFSAVETAVDDNNSRITDLEAALAAHIANTANPHSVTKTQIGLADVDNIRANLNATTAPTANDDINNGYSAGSFWLDTTQQNVFILVDSSPGSAVWKEITNRPYAIGREGPAGGIVFYITDGGYHGLEVAPADQSSGAAWGCDGTDIAGADGTAVGTGAQNTADILADCTTAGTAARVADAYSLNGFDDWFLPSRDALELMNMELHQKGLGGFTDNYYYWSSSELSSITALSRYFSGGGANYTWGKAGTLIVRAIRAF